MYSSASIPPESMWPRVIVRFAPERDLFISGELAGGGALAETPAVVDVPVGKGHVVFLRDQSDVATGNARHVHAGDERRDEFRPSASGKKTDAAIESPVTADDD